MKESILYQMPSLIKFFVVAALLFAVFLWWNNRCHPAVLGLLKNRIRVVTLVRQKIFGSKAVNQSDCLSAIRCCTLCNKSPERHTMRIHGQMQFCVEPPFVRLMSWLPPLAPAAWG